MLLLGAVGRGGGARRPTLLRVFLVWVFVVSLVVYSWAGEKFAWLVLHPLLPLLLLAGVGAQAIWSARRPAVRAAGLAAIVLALAYTGYASFLVNAVHRADPRELLVSTQSSEAVAARRRRGARGRRPSSITVDATRARRSPGRGTSATRP